MVRNRAGIGPESGWNPFGTGQATPAHAPALARRFLDTCPLLDASPRSRTCVRAAQRIAQRFLHALRPTHRRVQ
jgi:hypothetical protein